MLLPPTPESDQDTRLKKCLVEQPIKLSFSLLSIDFFLVNSKNA